MAGALRIGGRIGRKISRKISRRTEHWREDWHEDVVNERQARKLLYRKPWLVCR